MILPPPPETAVWIAAYMLTSPATIQMISMARRELFLILQIDGGTDILDFSLVQVRV